MEKPLIEQLLGPNWKRRLLVWGAAFATILSFIAITVFVLVMYGMNSSWAYGEGTRLAKSNVRLVQELGEPIEFGWFVTGQINVAGDAGTADIAIPVHGNLNKGKVCIVGHKRHGQWKVDESIARVHGVNDVIDLLSNSNTTK
jgi:hypothetical protein